ncbi:ankyrin repeat-containing domain protein, partial [Cladorrhinum sp. PSN332]
MQSGRKYQEVLDRLTDADYAPQHQDFLARRQPGTWNWLLESERFKTWVVTVENRTLFYPGIPGAGKTLLRLPERGADPNQRVDGGATLLTVAVNRGEAAIVQHLLERGADANLKDGDGQTPLFHVEADGNNPSFAQLLPQKDDDCAGVRNEEMGQTAICLAAEMGDEAIVNVLLCHSTTDPNLSDSSSRTPLAYAPHLGNVGLFTALISDSRVNPYSRDVYGSTSLSIALRCGRAEIAEVLLCTGVFDANLNDKDYFGRTALWWARRGGEDVRRIIVEYANRKGISLLDDAINGSGES